MDSKIRSIVKKLTLEEKVSLCSGTDFWHTKVIERLQIPSVMVSDGPSGLRKQNPEAGIREVNNSIESVCFPAAVNLASSFDTDLVRSVGEAIGDECQAEDVAAILAPGCNIKRSPLCGRNFEYYSEDPYLSGKTAAAYINGVQSKGVGTSLKHFCANNQEFRRNSYDSRIDERTLREIYLKGFEIAVKESQPWTVMCAYNMVNGVQMSENKRLLTDILRKEWGFEGLVVSDWGAVRDRVKGIAAGLDLEMPGNGGIYDRLVIDAVKNKELAEEDLDACVERILEFVYKAVENHEEGRSWDKGRHHSLVRDIAGECMVLLKNENKVLPVKSSDYVLLVGGFAKNPRYQGGGSSHIRSGNVDSILMGTQWNSKIIYEEGFSATDDKFDKARAKRAVAAASDVDKVVIFAGLPESYESEGYDRKHMDLPQVQNDLINAIAAVNPHVIVVLENGSPVTMPWADKVEGILETYLSGEGVGVATALVLSGKINPSGRLPEMIPLRLEDNPSYLNFAGDSSVIDYREGIFVGYRYYSRRKMQVRFPFGHGLSYSTFSYGKMTVDAEKMLDNETLEVTVDVINESDIPGKEVVQLYVEADILNTKIRRVVRELKGFKKVFLDAHERKTVSFILDKSAFAYYDEELSDWYVEPGEYKIEVCRNAEEVITYKTVTVIPKKPKKPVYSENSVYKDIMEDSKAARIAKPFYEKAFASSDVFEDQPKECEADTTIRSVVNLNFGDFSYEEMREIINRLNGQKED